MEKNHTMATNPVHKKPRTEGDYTGAQAQAAQATKGEGNKKFQALPEDVFSNIFSQLSLADQTRAQQACRTLRDRVSNMQNAKK